jgi:hypothetical protein
VADKPVYRLRFNGAAAAVVIAIVFAAVGTWLTLVLVGLVNVESIYPFLERLGYFVTGGLLPGMFSLWRERRIAFDITSDPPSKGPPDAAS